MNVNINLIRHGATAGNLKKRYIGSTDEPLCDQGIEELSGRRLPRADAWFLSPLRRCLETAEILSAQMEPRSGIRQAQLDRKMFRPDNGLPSVEPFQADRELVRTNAELLQADGSSIPSNKRAIWENYEISGEVRIIPDFRECDFGLFENKNYLELADCSEYQRWIDSGGTLPFPGGEAPEDFKKRCCLAFARVLEEIFERDWQEVCLVVHGGTIMSIMERYALPKKDYYQWHVPNGGGYRIHISASQWRTQPYIKTYEIVEEEPI